jgi:F-type H+-transporting ATPase subunit delta
MREDTIARIYAAAVMQAAEEKGKRKAILDELVSLAEILDAEPDFRSFLESPQIDRNVKKQAIETMFGDKLDRLTKNFLGVLLDKNRQYLIGRIAHEYRRLDDEKEGIMEVLVTSARPVDADFREEIRAGLERRLEGPVRLTVDVNPSLIGGITIRYEDRLLDGSIRRRLEDLRERTSSIEIQEGLLYED